MNCEDVRAIFRGIIWDQVDVPGNVIVAAHRKILPLSEEVLVVLSLADPSDDEQEEVFNTLVRLSVMGMAKYYQAEIESENDFLVAGIPLSINTTDWADFLIMGAESFPDVLTISVPKALRLAYRFCGSYMLLVVADLLDDARKSRSDKARENADKRHEKMRGVKRRILSKWDQEGVEFDSKADFARIHAGILAREEVKIVDTTILRWIRDHEKQEGSLAS